jgi:hypothetical protein
MKDKEKQIKEMAKIMCSPCPDGKECSGTWCYKRVSDCANEFYEQGYRKIPEDSVVLSKAKYREFLEMKRDMINNTQYKRGSKETAKKILNELVGHTFEDDGWTWTVSKEDIQWLAEKYKVEIKE